MFKKCISGVKQNNRKINSRYYKYIINNVQNFFKFLMQLSYLSLAWDRHYIYISSIYQMPLFKMT